MKTARYIKRLVRRLDVEPTPAMRERTIADAVRAHLSHAGSARHGRRVSMGRRVGGMVAAAVVLCGLLGAIVSREWSAPVYAIEQTVAAIKKVSIVHILGRDWDDRRVEMWMKVNPDTGLMHSCHVRYLDEDRFLVSTPMNTYDYDGRTNAVRIQDGPSVASMFCLGDFFQGMERLAEGLDGKITYCEVTDPATRKDILELKLSAPQTEIVCLIDGRTKLPISINTTRGGRFNAADILRHATEIHYEDAPPEGIFDFTIPAGATLSLETTEDPLQSLPLSALRHCGQLHLHAVRELGEPNGIPVNTRIYFVGDDFELRNGGFVGVNNDSNEVWEGEIGVFNVDLPQMALFDASSGRKQQIRIVQRRPFPPGRFRVYWRFDTPLPPGQTRYGIYWAGPPEKLPTRSDSQTRELVMQNSFGAEAIENFVLVVPGDIDVEDSSREHQAYTTVDDLRVYVWQRHLPEERVDNRVEVRLSRASADYSDAYIAENAGKVLVEIPEAFELANVAIAISETGLKDPYKVNKSGEYYRRVLEHFLPFKNHPLLAQPTLHYNHGYPFRDNSICYAFEGDKLVSAGPYRRIRDPDLFQQQLALLEDFARVSGFRQFYRENLPFYRQQIELYREKVPIRRMWTWLEERFPARHDCYKVVFSPLLGGSHETCGFTRKGFSETIMFVSGPGESPDWNSVGEGLLARVVFTEIDHNYVNSITSRHTEQVNAAFADLGRWNRNAGYASPEMTFNEYMTWGVFILYAHDTYEMKDFEAIKEHVIRQMVGSRQFIRFREFTEELLRLYRDRTAGQSIPDLYPAVLSWAQKQPWADANTAGWLEDDAWMIIGPFDNPDGAGFETPYPPEKEIDFSKVYAGQAGQVKWFRPGQARGDGLVDLALLLGRRNWAVAYAAATVQSPEARPMELRVGSDDDVKAWLNGELVLSRNADRAAVPDQDVVPVTLRKGENRLLLKVCNRLYSWGFYARIVDANVPRYAFVAAPPKVTRQEAIDDLSFLVGQLKARHARPFAKVSEEDLNREIERIKANLAEEVTVREFSLSIAALLALVGDDHTRHRDFSTFAEHVNNGGKVFPVKLRYQDSRMTVEAWSPEVSPARMKVGDAVTAINSQSMESLLQRYGRYMSLETDLQKWWALEWAIEKYQVLLGDARDQYILQMQDGEGRAYSEMLPAVKPWLERYARSKSQAPRFHRQFYQDGKVCLFKLQTFNWDLRAELEAKADALVDEMKQNGTQVAILDLRGNGGGNSNMGSMVFTKLIDKPYGELRPDQNHSWPVKMVLLCDRGTYSAGSFEAMLFKDYGMGIVAGEETGGRASGSGNIEHVTLPNSRLVCGIATGYFPRRAGYDDGRGVLPDLPLDVTLNDSVLVEEICAHVRKPGRHTELPYQNLEEFLEFVRHVKKKITIERTYKINTKEELALAPDQAARLSFQDNPAGVAEFLFLYDGNAVHVIYRAADDTERQYSSTWLNAERMKDSRGVYATGATTYLKCSTEWEPEEGHALIRFRTDLPLEQEQQDFDKQQVRYRLAAAVREWDFTENVVPFTMAMDEPNDPNMVKLRTKYGLDEVVRGAGDEYEKLRLLLAWAQKRWKHNGSNTPSKYDPLTILEEASEGKEFRCVEYAIVVASCARALGMPSRTLGLKRPDVETAESGAGHVVAEVWLRQFDKWVFMDGQWGAMAERDGVPLNAVEFQDAIARKQPGLKVRLVSGGSQEDYLEWILPYLYYLDFNPGNLFYPSASQQQAPRVPTIMLVPKGAAKPRVFQRNSPIRNCTYTSNPAAFYPRMGE